jgi:hypothetical protein
MPSNWNNAMPDMKSTEVQRAVRDLKERTLECIPSRLARLLYLASTRDYSTGRYYHDGLACKFTSEATQLAIEIVHREAFEMLVYSSLEVFVKEFEIFINCTRMDPRHVLETWKKFQPYHVVIPHECDSIASELFYSNVRIALTVLGERLAAKTPYRQSALQPQ